MFKALKWKELGKKEKISKVFNEILVILGNLSLAFGTAIFLTKLDIVAGGLSGIGIIIQHFIGSKQIFSGILGEIIGSNVIDIIVFILTWMLWGIGRIFVGKDFAMKTLASAILYPLALALFMRLPVFQNIAENISYFGLTELEIQSIVNNETFAPISNLFICGVFGGLFIGLGVGFNFLGGGSTGGVDVIIAIVNKYFGIKEAVVSFILDASVILVGMFLIKKNGEFNLVPALCGIVSCFITAVVIDAVIVIFNLSYQLDVISNKWEEISRFAQDELGRGATIIKAEGGYKGDERVILRIVFTKRQYNRLKNFIADVDPKAFVTITKTNAVFGEGFKKHADNKKSK